MTPESTSEEISAESLRLKLTDILEKWPLYRKFTYRGEKGHEVVYTSSRKLLCGTLPERICLYCSQCQNDQQWEVKDPKVYFGHPNYFTRRYGCRNCGERSSIYFFVWMNTEEGGIFFKLDNTRPLVTDHQKRSQIG